MKRSARSLVLVLLAAMVVGGCQSALPQPQPTAPGGQDAAYTQAAQTIVAELTRSAPATPTQPPPVTPATPTTAIQPTDTPVLPETPPPTEPLPPTEALTPTLGALPTATATGISLPTVTPGGQVTPTLPSTPLATAVDDTAGWRTAFEDDFSFGIGWEVQREDNWSLTFGDGGYRIFVDFPGDAIWSVKSESYVDVRIEVDVTRQEGPSDGYYGVVCRQESGSNYYGLVISPNGTYGILQKRNGTIQFLQENTVPSPAIQTGFGATNRVRGDCVGDTLTLYANGQRLLEVQNSDFPSGSAGMLAGTRRQTGLRVLFDNLAILTP